MNNHENVIPISGEITLPAPETPITNGIIEQASKLSKVSSYNMDFDFEAYRSLEQRSQKLDMRGGFLFKSPFKLANFHSTCQQCLYAFEIDTYGRGCTHDCVYCYAKAQLTVHGMWNKPFPAPIDISSIWKTFYTVFETNKRSKWRDVLEKRIPIRIGSMSDSFMWMDRKYKVTQEFLKILKHYNYPYIIFTRSDLIATDEYLNLLDPDLCSVQMSIASTNDHLNKLIEPGTPSAKRRLLALQKLTRAGFWTTVRLNPFFPMHPDGYFTDPDLPKEKRDLYFDFSSFDMVDEIAQHGVQSILAGVVRLSSFSLNQIEKACDVNLRSFYKEEVRKSKRDWHYSKEEVRAYYERIHAKCIQNKIEFTTCYIGNGENQFWSDQDLWTNKKDCCNAINRVKGFKGTNSRDLEWDKRLKHSPCKTLKPNDANSLHTTLGSDPKGIQ
jgi:DNA repair photolyase